MATRFTPTRTVSAQTLRFVAPAPAASCAIGVGGWHTRFRTNQTKCTWSRGRRTWWPVGPPGLEPTLIFVPHSRTWPLTEPRDAAPRAVDRLTRSLSDFAKLVERLEAAGAVFVSVTQSFNTATSMGRLTLHMLLSFAQFEREVTAERIRDKVAASKRKGLWMGGRVPLGYEKDERTLRINEAEAETVRTLYALYLKHGTLRQVKAEADRLRLRTKQRFAADGTRTGGLPFRRGHLHCLLTNPLYAGRIRHQRRVYEGQHPSIIAPELWDAVQTQLQAGAAKPRRRTTKGCVDRSPLAGKLFDETGDRLTPSHTKKKTGQRLRYYVSRRLIQHSGHSRKGPLRLATARPDAGTDRRASHPTACGCHDLPGLVDPCSDDARARLGASLFRRAVFR